MITPERRKELKAKLRAKIEQGKGPQNVPMTRQLKQDPTSALLSMGIDDPEMLKSMVDLVNHPQRAAQLLKREVDAARKMDTEEEEAPPP